jgi:hypothetical protein
MNVQYQLAELQPSVFLITSDNRYDLAQLFACVQEFYESSDPQWKGKHFPREVFERWYALNQCEDHIFSYPMDWSGFNVPSWAIDEFYKQSPYNTDNNFYDRMIKHIDSLISERIGVDIPYYLIGTQSNDLETLDHEIAHGLYATSPGYKMMMDEQIGNLPTRTRNRLASVLTNMGYAESVHDDEIQANFATGLTSYFKGFQRFCPPFIEAFEQYRQPFNPDFTIVHPCP